LNHLDLEKYIQGETGLSCGKQMLLKRALQKNAGNLLSLSRFINDLNTFREDLFEDLPSPKKSEIIISLLEAMEKMKFNSAFREIIEIIFGEEGKEGKSPTNFPQSFSALILGKSRLADNFMISPLLVELTLTGSNIPVQGSSLFDYMPGLHHKDDLIRCKTLNFLYHHFEDSALPPILQEVLKMNPPPSILFCGTLGHFFCRHPNISWAKGLKREDLSLDNWDRKDGRWLFLKTLLDSCSRIQFLSLITGEKRREDDRQKKLELKRRKETFGLRLERFKAIEIQPKRR